MVFWVVLGALWLLFLGFLGYDYYQQIRKKDRAGNYRRLFIQIVTKTQNSVTLLNRMKDLMEHLEEPKLLKNYEECLEIQKVMLEALVKTHHYGIEQKHLRHSYQMADILEQRVRTCFARVKDTLQQQGKALELGQGKVRGCYFCSRPYLIGRFKVVATRVSGVVVKVSSCPWCHAELMSVGKVRVLYFKRGEERVHWSKINEYDPEQDFWQLHDRHFLKNQKLKIVYDRGESVGHP